MRSNVKWRAVTLTVILQVLAFASWFSTTAIVPALRAEYG
jgi:hypothetical protein